MEDLARMELERGEYLSVVCNKETRDGLSQCIVVLSYRQRRREPEVGQATSCPRWRALGSFGRDLTIGQHACPDGKPRKKGCPVSVGPLFRTIASLHTMSNEAILRILPRS